MQSHSTASRPSAGAKARARAPVIFVLFVMFRSLPFVSVATGAGAPPLGNTQDTPGNGAGFGVRKGSDRRAQTPRGLQAVVTAGLSALRGCVGELRYFYAGGAVFSYSHANEPARPLRNTASPLVWRNWRPNCFGRNNLLSANAPSASGRSIDWLVADTRIPALGRDRSPPH